MEWAGGLWTSISFAHNPRSPVLPLSSSASLEGSISTSASPQSAPLAIPPPSTTQSHLPYSSSFSPPHPLFICLLLHNSISFPSHWGHHHSCSCCLWVCISLSFSPSAIPHRADVMWQISRREAVPHLGRALSTYKLTSGPGRAPAAGKARRGGRPWSRLLLQQPFASLAWLLSQQPSPAHC